MDLGRATTAEIVRQRDAGRTTMGPTLRGRVASTIYKGEQISSGFTLRLAAFDPSSYGELCRTCVEFFGQGDRFLPNLKENKQRTSTLPHGVWIRF